MESFVEAVTAEATARHPSRRTRRWLLPALAAAAVAVIAVVSVLVVSEHPTHRTPPAQPAATVDRNRLLTTAETIRLVGLVTLPPGSSATAVQPALLGYPAAGIPESTSLIDTVRYWRVPLVYSKAVAWMATHPPAGVRLGGTSGPTGAQTQFSGYLFDASASSAWEQASLQIGIVPSSSASTAWRVDGMALWVDPRPNPDTLPGPRLHVTVAAGCPASDNGAHDVTNRAAGLTTSLLPPGAPSAALFCVYSGDDGSNRALIRHRLVSAAEARQLAEVARAVSNAHVEVGPHSCPLYAGPAGVLAFTYPDGRDISLWFDISSCGYFSNGSIFVSIFDHAGSDDLVGAVYAATR